MITKFDGDLNLPITAAEFNETGDYLALAFGYDWGKGVEGFKYFGNP